MLTATYLQSSTYLLGVCLASISFVVFISSTSSFLIRDLLGIQRGVGDLVGTLGFVDELVALVACPVWGILSDRIGVRAVSVTIPAHDEVITDISQVCVLGYAIIGVSLFVTVQAKNVYPHLLLARIFFALGGAATYVHRSYFSTADRTDIRSSTMITALLPCMVAPAPINKKTSTPSQSHLPVLESSHSTSPSVSSELTITPARLAIAPRPRPATRPSEEPSSHATSPPRLAGVVGVFTGCGALVALVLFLPLPTRFSQLEGVTPAQAMRDSYYVVGAIALLISVICFIGLRNLRGEEEKGWTSSSNFLYAKSLLMNRSSTDTSPSSEPTPYSTLFLTSVKLGFTHPDIGLSYLGGFVARYHLPYVYSFISLRSCH